MSRVGSTTVRVFEPNELAADERERLLAALEGFVNMSDSLEGFLAYGKQNPDFFPVRILDDATRSETPLSPPAVQGTSFTEQGEKPEWTKVIAWEPACHKLALLYRDGLRRSAWPGPHDPKSRIETMRLLAIDAPVLYADWNHAFQAVREGHPSATAIAPAFSRLIPDWKTGTFEYAPENDFQRAVYILFREGWRAKTCARCSRRFIAGKPRQMYCSTHCFEEVKRERGNQWWSAHGKRWRAKRAAKGAGAGKKSGPRKRTAKGAK